MHLGNSLMTEVFGQGRGAATILLSHTHWDHIQGLGFFAPVFTAGNSFTVWGPGGSPKALEDILEGQMDPNFSPLQSLRNFNASFDVRAVVVDQPFEAEGVTITAREHAHGVTTALSFRIDREGDLFMAFGSLFIAFGDERFAIGLVLLDCTLFLVAVLL